MGRLNRLYKTDRARDFDHETDRYVRMQQIYDTIDRQRFQWIVVFVAGVGFFLDGYTLFASNIALPMITYVYWQNDVSSKRSTFINIATLGGTLLGQVAFGFLADKNGRKKMYGVELVLLITSTLGVTMASTGEHASMNIFAWLIWWRIVTGIGVGADYPLSAVITSEFAPTKHRARMLAAVFFMQPLGQVAGNLVSLIVVAVTRGNGNDDPIRSVDIMWRWVIGIGVVPAVVASLFRFAIPETPRYLLDIDNDPIKAEFDASALFGEQLADVDPEFDRPWDGSTLPASSSFSQVSAGSIDGSSVVGGSISTNTEYTLHPPTLQSHWRLAYTDMVHYFWTEGNWRTLVGTSLAWMFLDFGFYGIGLSSPQFLAKAWGSLNLHGPAPSWKTDDSPNANIFTMFFNTSVHAMVILNTGSVIGGLLLILIAPKVNRVSLQKYGFLTLAALFIAMGVMFITTHQEGPVAVVLYIIGQLLFNLGPNATTYMIPAEVFPTRYRAFCHGLSAGAGKLGSILVQLLSAYYNIGSSGAGNDETQRYGWILVVFSAAMIVGAGVTHFFIPSIQSKRRGVRTCSVANFWGGEKEKTLETLALGRLGESSRYAVRRTRTVHRVHVRGAYEP
ncbi:phosphate transporter [Talaromyces proteolyticus]|uniref:Phosphate transporter n=1 Tax=Talaromyces proteolyticus TaxID=1131652 RepID=A0AAD4KWI2_9EURO|nr:phosphate transporter [Talaromyces proteolyticus]KAH8702477.1 phosphate transporter [Talaromyces proteolyticus]